VNNKGTTALELWLLGSQVWRYYDSPGSPAR
jgi:hypothetical protein